MATPIGKWAFVTGEVSPSLFGHVDLVRLQSAASTLRNMFVSYRGGAYSRAGTAFVGLSKQTGSIYPPRLIPFQFSINQGLALEFGNYYMRVIYDGAFVTQSPLSITGASKTSPAVINATATGALAVAPNNAGVIGSYSPGDKITLAGGSPISPTVINVLTVGMTSIGVSNPGTGYLPNDTVTLSGGAVTVAPILKVLTTQISGIPTIANAGASGTPGNAVLTGTTGLGVKFQVNATINNSGQIASINSIVSGGAYVTNPTTLAAEPVVGAGLVGATLGIAMGVGTSTVTTQGVFTSPPGSTIFTQGATSGAGTGATFQYAIFGPATVSLASAGAYSIYPGNPVQQGSTTGTGVGAAFNITPGPVPAANNGDWIYISGVAGMTQLNNRAFMVGNAGANSMALFDVFGNPIDATAYSAYTGGGTLATIYTLPTPYAAVDLPWLKFTQSADVMSMTCVNQDTGTEYPPQELVRITDANWTITALSTGQSVTPPSAATVVASAGGSVDYQYCVTSVDPVNGTESIASPVASVNGAVDIASTAGTMTVSWPQVQGIQEYNIYKATPGYGAQPPVGALFGYAGSAYGAQFIDTNIIADFAQVPPKHSNPFARGQIITANVLASGTGYTSATASVNSATGSGASLTPIIQNGGIVGFIRNDAGAGYLPADTITISGNGQGAQAVLVVGAETGTYPSVVAYFQERRVYGNSLNNPDTYWFSQPGAFTNFDSRIPTIESDAIVGTPWSVQVNGIQFMVPMPGGLVVLTGSAAWQLTGSGGSSLNPQPISPSTQQAQPQAYNGCSATVPPVKIDYDIIYLQAKGSIYRDLAYNFYTNIYTGSDLTQNSSQLFAGFTIREHAWCEEPYKVLWAVRNDGVLLSMTYLKPQEVIGWGRHDTNGLFQSVCAITEPPVDALYTAVQRVLNAATVYTIERMDNRIWNSVESSWCVDCGLTLAQATPAATLSASSATGLGSIIGAANLVGGQNYSPGTIVSVVDQNGQGPGIGALATPTIVNGVITAITLAPGSQGANYQFPAFVIYDPANTGSGASATPVLNNTMTFTASAPVFSPANVGSVIRMGGGVATVTGYINAMQLTASITTPIATIQANSGGLVQPAAAGAWTIAAPTATVGGLWHLVGQRVTGLADGNVIPPQTVSANGTITLAAPASAITVGLGFQAQLQSVYLEAGTPTVQGQRKKIPAATARIESSRGLKIGANQPDGSTLSPPQIAPTWANLSVVTDLGVTPYNSTTTPLYTGDVRIPVSGGYAKPGQVCIQQDNPLPCNVLALIIEDLQGDAPEQKAEKREPQRQRAA